MVVLLCVLISLSQLTGCATTRPDNVDDVCKIFKQYPEWYWSTAHTQSKWGLPIAVQMAIIHQESRFTADARPPREKLLWVIPWLRPSSSYGYSQALKTTWRHYQQATGKTHASRNAFDDASDFIGWYAYQAQKRLGLSLQNARQLYLAYHEGMGGYEQRTYLAKPWLQAVASKVQNRAWIYSWQLRRCQSQLKKKPWWKVW